MVAVGAASFYGASQLAERYWHTHLDTQLLLGISAVCALITLVVTRRVAGFTEDCMGIPAAAGRVQCTKGTCARQDRARALEAGPKLLMAGTGDGSKTSSDAAGGPPDIDGDAPMVVVAEPSGSDSVIITVTTNGVPNSSLKGRGGLFERIENVSGVNWSKHTNIGPGRKQIIGVTSALTAASAIQRLQQIAAQAR